MQREQLIRPLLNRYGFIHRHDLLDKGWRHDAIRTAVAMEGLVGGGRQWILRPDAAEPLMLAAATSARVTCLTAAKILGLWVLEEPELPHLALPTSARRSPDEAHAHWSTGVVLRPQRTLIDRIENVLAVIARCQPYESARIVWDSAVRNKLVTPEDLHALPWRGERAIRLRDEACSVSHSGTETIFATRMRRLGVEVRQQVKIAGHHIDALVGKRVVVQIDGYAHHSDARQRRSDIAHDRELQRLGFVVYRFDYFEIINEWARVEATVLRALAREAR